VRPGDSGKHTTGFFFIPKLLQRASNHGKVKGKLAPCDEFHDYSGQLC
jgi:hypothetical protein